MLYSLLRLSCCKMGARPGLDLIRCRKGLIVRRNGFLVIINDDFLEEGECYGRYSTLRIAYRFISNLLQLRQGVDSLAQW